MNHWTSRELATLRRLREGFLNENAGAADYWRSAEEIAIYDATFAERIGWKWDAVLRELTARHWTPRSRRVLDWGCGSGVAGRRVLARWPGFDRLTLHDRSTLALRFAGERARELHPQVECRVGEQVDADTLLVVSHVLNELASGPRARLLESARRAQEILWVEAGTHANSRRLIEVREELLNSGEFVAVAPCTHQNRCGMLTTENAPHWCHHFASPPAEIFQDGRWAEFGRVLGIDLRALPYSFLVVQRAPQGATPPGFSRVIGRPRDAKGYSRVLSCQAENVTDLMVQKRDAPALLKQLQRGSEAPVYRWTIASGKIVAGEPLK